MSDELPPAEALHVAEGYGLGEVGEKHMSLPDVFARFGNERSWWIATTHPDGSPHVMPVWGVYVDEQLLFSSDPHARKSRNLDANAHIVVHLESGDQVAIVEGVAVITPGPEVPAGFTAAYNKKYGFEVDTSDPAFRFYRVEPTKVFSWDEGDFVDTAARWRF